MKSLFKSSLILTLLCLVGLILRIVFATEKSISFDEWLTYTSSLGIINPASSPLFNPHQPATAGYFLHVLHNLPHQTPWSLTNILSALHQDLNLPAYFILMSFWLRAIGHFSPLILRLPGILINVSCIPLFVLIGQQLQHKKAGWVAACLFTFSPYALFYASDARPYNLLMLLSLLGSFLTLQYEQQSGQLSVKQWILLGATFGLGILTHYFFLFPAAFWVIRLFKQGAYQSWRSMLWILLAAGIPTILAVSLIHHKVTGFNDLNPLKESFSWIHTGNALYNNLFSSWFVFPPFYKASIIPSLEFWILLSWFCIQGSIIFLKKRKTINHSFIQFCGLWFIFSLGGLFFAGLIFQSRILEVLRYWSIVVPPLYLILAAAVCSGPLWIQRIQISLFSLLTLFFIFCLHLSQGYPDFNYRAVCRVIQQNQSSGKFILTLTGYPTAAALSYYLPADFKIATIYTPYWKGNDRQRLSFLTQSEKSIWFTATFNQFKQVLYYQTLQSLMSDQKFIEKSSMLTERNPVVLVLLNKK